MGGDGGAAKEPCFRQRQLTGDIKISAESRTIARANTFYTLNYHSHSDHGYVDEREA